MSSGLDQQQRTQTRQALVTEYNLKQSAIQLPSKAQLRKAIFTKDYLKDKQFIRSSKHSKSYPGITSDHLAAARRGHTTSAPHGTAGPDRVFMSRRLLLVKGYVQEAVVPNPRKTLPESCSPRRVRKLPWRVTLEGAWILEGATVSSSE